MTTYAGGSAGQGQGRPTTKLQAPQDVLPANFGGYPEAGKTLYSGTMVGQDAAGNIVDLSDSTNPAINVLGVLRKNCVNVSGTGDPGATGLAGVAWGGGPLDIQAGGWTMVNDGTITATTPLGTDLYAKDNQTVSTENGGGGYLRAGWFCGFDAFSNPFCVFGPNPFAAGSIEPGAGTTPFYARAVVPTNLAAYGGTTTGVLTASANGAFPTCDGVSTIAVGDVVLVPEGITNLSAASDAGPYVVTSLGGAAAKWVLTRVSWWATGSQIPISAIKIGSEGTFWAGTEWKSFAVKGSWTVDTNAPKLYPGRVTQSITLVAGTVAVANVPVLSATRTGIEFVRTTANTCASTVQYALVGTITPGVIGTATFAFDATVAAGTINASDISSGNLTIINW
jgi:hypothetical protein